MNSVKLLWRLVNYSAVCDWLNVFVNHCVAKLLGGIVQCRAARHCQCPGEMARGHEHGRFCQAAWQDLWLHSAVELLGGWVHIGYGTLSSLAFSLRWMVLLLCLLHQQQVLECRWWELGHLYWHGLVRR